MRCWCCKDHALTLCLYVNSRIMLCYAVAAEGQILQHKLDVKYYTRFNTRVPGIMESIICKWWCSKVVFQVENALLILKLEKDESFD